MGKLIVTDGNQESLSSIILIVPHISLELALNVSHNFLSGTDVSAELLLWDTTFSSPGRKFDVILVADCLYCIPYHAQLLHTVVELMHESSVCIMTAPKRGYSLEKFIERLNGEPGLKYSVNEKITDKVDARVKQLQGMKSFSESEHKPYLIVIRRK